MWVLRGFKVLLPDFAIQKLKIFLFGFLSVSPWFFEESLSFFVFLEFDEGFNHQVTDINPHLALSLACLIWSTVTYSTFCPSWLVNLSGVFDFFLWLVQRSFDSFSGQCYFIVNRNESFFYLTLRQFLTVMLLSCTLLAELLTAAACALIMLFFDGFELNWDILSGEGSFLIQFLENVIVDVLQVCSESLIQVWNWSFSVFTAGNEHLAVLCSWHE